MLPIGFLTKIAKKWFWTFSFVFWRQLLCKMSMQFRKNQEVPEIGKYFFSCKVWYILHKNVQAKCLSNLFNIILTKNSIPCLWFKAIYLSLTCLSFKIFGQKMLQISWFRTLSSMQCTQRTLLQIFAQQNNKFGQTYSNRVVLCCAKLSTVRASFSYHRLASLRRWWCKRQNFICVS